MSITTIVPTEESSRKAATRVRIVFIVVLTALAIAFGVQLLSI